MILKLKIFIDHEGETILKDLYINADAITGFFVPDKLPEDEGRDCVNLFYNGDMLTVLQEKKLINYLTENFVRQAV